MIVNTFGEETNLAVQRPTEQVSFISYIEGLLTWTRGNGDYVILFVSTSPIGQLSLKDLQTFQQGLFYRDKGEVIYKGTGSELEIDLSAGIYYIAGLEFSGEPSTERYMVKGIAEISFDVESDKIFAIEFDDTFE